MPGGAEVARGVLEAFGAERVVLEEAPAERVAPHTELLARCEEELKLRGFSPRKRKVYLAHARRCLMHAGPQGDVIHLEHLRSYLLTLAGAPYSRAYHAQAASALRFFAAEVLKLPPPQITVPLPKRERKLPRPPKRRGCWRRSATRNTAPSSPCCSDRACA